VSNLPPDPYDRTRIVEPPLDNPDRAPLGGNGKDFVVTLTDTTETPGAEAQVLTRTGKWIPMPTTPLPVWGGIVGDITNQADLMAMFATKANISDLAQVAFSGNYSHLTNKPVLGTVSPINLDGYSNHVLYGDGVWRIPTDVYATWGNISGVISDQSDLMALLSAKAPLNNPVFTGIVRAPTPAVDNNSDMVATTAWFFGQAFNGSPLMDGVASSGDSTLWARGNHRHPSDTGKVDEAPNDGQQYARQSFAWTVVAAPSGGGGGGGGRVFYLSTSDPSDISTYYTLETLPSSGVEQTISTTCSGTGDFFLGAFATDPGVPGAVDLVAGSVSRRIYASSSGGAARLHMRVYLRNAAGIETLLRDEFSNSFIDTTATAQIWTATLSDVGVLLPTDRLVLKLYAQRVTGPASFVVTVYFEGTAHASSIQTTISDFGTLAYNDFTVNDTAPTGNMVGDRWVKPATGEEMVWVPPGAWLNPAQGAVVGPGGSTTQVQFNDGGVFGGDADFVFDKTNNVLTLGNPASPGKIQGMPGAATSAGGDLTVVGGAGSGTAQRGGSINITGGFSTIGGAGAKGGDVNITSGFGGQNSTGGDINIIADSGSTNSTSGAITIKGKDLGSGPISIAGGSRSAGGAAGAVTIKGGAGITAGTGGALVCAGGDGGGGPAGAATFQGGDATGNGVSGATVTLRGGHSSRSTIGGTLNGAATIIQGGNALGNTNSGAGGAIQITGGIGGVSGGVGGAVTIAGGAPQADNGGGITLTAAAGVGTNKNGGSITLTPGAATGSGVAGIVAITPTAGEASLTFQAAAAQNKILYFQTSTSKRWAVASNATAESGANAGSDFSITRYTDAGALVDSPLSIFRSDGSMLVLGNLNRYIFKTSGVYNNGTYDGVQWLNTNSTRGTMNLLTVDLPASWHGWRMGVDAQVFDFQSSGSGYAQVSWLTYSDRRLKESLEPIKDALAKVADLTGYTFERNDAKELDGTARKQAGLIAQDVLPVLPQAVSEAHDADMKPVMALDYNGIVALLVNAVKELTLRVSALEVP